MSVISLQVSEPLGPRTATAEVYSFGAHVTSWRDCTAADHLEYLFLSKTAILDGSKPIRGGIPICWPQFGSFGAMSAHGFARNRVWTLTSLTNQNSDVESSCIAVFSLGPTEPVDAWPHSCSLQYRVTLSWTAGEQSSRLKCELAVTNVGSSALSFTGALHAYFTVSDISNASVSPLGGLSYLDQLQKGDDNRPKRLVSNFESEHFSCEFDRIYQDAFRSEQQHTLQIHDSGLNRSINIVTHNLPDAVVWNAWIAKAASMADMELDGWKRYVCVEPAVIMSPVHLQAGQTFDASISLAVVARK